MYGRSALKPFPGGNSSPRWQGWFGDEIKSAEDLKGLKSRTTGLGSEMCAKFGMAVQAMDGRDMFQMLQSSTLDAGEFIGPWRDSALGFYQVARTDSWPGVDRTFLGRRVRRLPEDIIVAMGRAAEDVTGALCESGDTLRRKIAGSFVSYRDTAGHSMTYPDNGEMNARAKVLGFPFC